VPKGSEKWPDSRALRQCPREAKVGHQGMIAYTMDPATQVSVEKGTRPEIAAAGHQRPSEGQEWDNGPGLGGRWDWTGVDSA